MLEPSTAPGNYSDYCCRAIGERDWKTRWAPGLVFCEYLLRGNTCAIGDVHNLKYEWQSFFRWQLREWMRQEMNVVRFVLLMFAHVVICSAWKRSMWWVWVLGRSETSMWVVDQEQMNAQGFAKGSLYVVGCDRTLSFWLYEIISYVFLTLKFSFFYVNVKMINWFYFIHSTYHFLKLKIKKYSLLSIIYIYNMYKVRPKDKGITRIRAHWGGGWVILLMHDFLKKFLCIDKFIHDLGWGDQI
jgi:hypothetical protein